MKKSELEAPRTKGKKPKHVAPLAGVAEPKRTVHRANSSGSVLAASSTDINRPVQATPCNGTGGPHCMISDTSSAAPSLAVP